MQYEKVWDAVDKLARLNGMSPSGLARKAGLDATTFNKSKRVRADGKKRWPSLDSINKILIACNISFDQFYNLIEDDFHPDSLNEIPCISFTQLETGALISDGVMDTENWNRIHFPENTVSMYAVGIDVSDYDPVYRKGSKIIAAKNSEIRQGDRIIVFFKDREATIREFVHRTASTLVLGDVTNPENKISANITDIEMVNRILWAEQ